MCILPRPIWTEPRLIIQFFMVALCSYPVPGTVLQVDLATSSHTLPARSYSEKHWVVFLNLQIFQFAFRILLIVHPKIGPQHRGSASWARVWGSRTAPTGPLGYHHLWSHSLPAATVYLSPRNGKDLPSNWERGSYRDTLEVSCACGGCRHGSCQATMLWETC